MLTRRVFNRQLLGLGAAALGFPVLASAQGGDYPSRPIRIIVPYAAGGGPDVLTRKMAVRMAEALGKGAVVIVDNIVGAGGILAAQNVARMAPDGYNILLGASSHLVQKAMQPSVTFDPVKDFVHVTRTAFSPSILVVSASSPYRTVDDLVAAAKKEPGKLNFASGGVGSAAHMCAAAIALLAKIDIVHVPYKGSVEIVPSIIQGATQFAVPIASTAIPQIQAGTVRALAVTSAQRMPSLPAATPPAVVDTLFKAVAKTYEDAALRADSEAAGAPISLSASPAEFTKFVEAEAVKLDKLVKAAHLSVDK